MWLNLLIAIIGTIIRILLTPKPKVKKPKPAKLDDFNLTNADEGTFVPKVYGTAWISPYNHWYGHLKTKPVKEEVDKK